MKENTNSVATPERLLAAADFAARKHRDQRRKDAEGTPYVNHPIRVASLLASAGAVTDIVTLQAALLHDTIEDTATTPEELESLFGSEVREVVLEVTDDKLLPKAERKRLQVLHAPHLSSKAKLIKLADKIANVTELTITAPQTWPVERKRAYLEWAERVVAGIRGTNGPLEQMFDEVAAQKRCLFAAGEGVNQKSA